LTWPEIHPPVLTGLLVWLLVAWWFGPAERNRVGSVARPAGTPESLTSAVGGWLDVQAGDPVGEDEYVPMLLVAASGGGAKAAYWTDLVLDCAFGEALPGDDSRHAQAADECPGDETTGARFDRLFLTSSVSGGSVGVYHLVREQAAIRAGGDWLDHEEVLSPLLAWACSTTSPGSWPACARIRRSATMSCRVRGTPTGRISRPRPWRARTAARTSRARAAA
jgi:hypothetical protein